MAYLREDIFQGIDESDVHLITDGFHHTSIIDWVVHQTLQFRELCPAQYTNAGSTLVR